MTTATAPTTTTASKLTDRQIAVLRSLAERASVNPPDAYCWRIDTALAFEVEGDLIKAGLVERRGRSMAIGASNTLAVLRKRGLVAKGGDGCYVQAQWWLTPAGAEALAGLSS